MLPGRVPAAAARLSRPEDPRSVAEALYDESLGDDVGSMLRELLDLHAIRVSVQMPRQAGLALDERRGGWDRSCWSCRYAITGAIGHRRWVADAHQRRAHDRGMLYYEPTAKYSFPPA
jgi:hypothetical protein